MSYGVCQYNKGQANGWPYWQLHPIYRVLSGAKAPREIVLGGSRQQKGKNVMRYLSAVCFLAIVAFADASPAAAQQNCGTPGLPARRSAPRAHPLGQHYRPTER